MRLSPGSHALPGWWWRDSLLPWAPPVPPAQPDPAATARAELQAAGISHPSAAPRSCSSGGTAGGKAETSRAEKELLGLVGSQAAKPWQDTAGASSLPAQAAIAVCSKIAFNMTRGVGWAGSAGSRQLFPCREPVYTAICYSAVCFIVLYLSSSSTYGNSSTAWHLEGLDLALEQAQTNTHLGQCSLPLTIPTSPRCLKEQKQAGSAAGPFQLKAFYVSVLPYPIPSFYSILFHSIASAMASRRARKRTATLQFGIY